VPGSNPSRQASSRSESPPASLAARMRPPRVSGAGRGAVAQETEDCRPEANVGRHAALFPIEEGAGVAADRSGGVLLPETAVEAGTLQVLAHRPGVLGVVGFLAPAPRPEPAGLGERIRAAREAEGLSEEALAIIAWSGLRRFRL
jgi:hypothetical protein